MSPVLCTTPLEMFHFEGGRATEFGGSPRFWSLLLRTFSTSALIRCPQQLAVLQRLNLPRCSCPPRRTQCKKESLICVQQRALVRNLGVMSEQEPDEAASKQPDGYAIFQIKNPSRSDDKFTLRIRLDATVDELRSLISQTYEGRPPPSQQTVCV
jgi:hypothetical protein